MAHVTSGIRRLLEFGVVYNFAMDLLGWQKGLTRLVTEFIRPQVGMKILDIGCGTSEVLTRMPKDINYFGIDLNEKYIAKNKIKYPYAKFETCKATDLHSTEKFDLIICSALLHHLENNEVEILLKTISNLLLPTGRVVILDPVKVPNQQFIAKFLINIDRGQNIKTEDGYKVLANKYFKNLKCTVTNLSQIPYNHLITEATN
jgi:2-polyprenyl-3-methyl-5-hydroxy-6-metoxy-1,4-benzoquinol methylase